MDLFHRKSQGEDTRNGRECRFCCATDPDFSQRRPIDRLVHSMMDDTASAHITEEGYTKLRIAELRRKRASVPTSGALPLSA